MTPRAGRGATRGTARLLLESSEIGGVVEVARAQGSAMTNACGGPFMRTSAYRLPITGAAFRLSGVKPPIRRGGTMFSSLGPENAPTSGIFGTIQNDHQA